MAMAGRNGDLRLSVYLATHDRRYIKLRSDYPYNNAALLSERARITPDSGTDEVGAYISPGANWRIFRRAIL